MFDSSLPARVVAALGCACVLSVPLAAQSAKVGDTPQHQFGASPLNGGGVKSLADLRGKPVLVDFWGTRCPPCVGFAVPAALKLAEQYGDDIAVVLVECQGSNADQVAEFALGKKWLGTTAMWTTERVFDLGLDGIPQSALLSPSGEIVVAGYTSKIHGEVEDRIAALVKESKRPPENTPKALSGVWRDAAKGMYCKALAAARKIVEKGDNDRSAAEAMITEIQGDLDKAIARAEQLVADGCAHEGLAALQDLEDEVEAESEIAERVKTLIASIESDELAAAKACAKLEQKLFEKGPDAGIEARLRGIASKYPNTKGAERANRLAGWANPGG